MFGPVRERSRMRSESGRAGSRAMEGVACERGESIDWRFMPRNAHCTETRWRKNGSFVRRALPMMAHPCSERLGGDRKGKYSYI
jgi:hypothetical protein